MNKTYVITGATSGIGKETVKKLAKENRVFAGYRNEDLKTDLEKISKNIVPFYIDMTSDTSIDEAAKFISFQCEKIDTLINVAGCVVAGATEEINVEKIRYQFEVNTFSHFQFTQKLLPKLYGGKIINISSMASYGVFPFVAPYCASKRALDILFNSMQIELCDKIKIISLKPGVIATPLWEKSLEANEDLETDKKYSKEYKYLIKNAKSNAKKGLDVQRVVEKIIKIDTSTKPKSDYTIGFDAKFAEILSKLPQEWINYIIKTGLKFKV